MYLEISREGSAPDVTLVEPHDFKSFKIVVRPGLSVDDVEAALRNTAELVDPRNARVSIEALRALSGCSGDVEWERGFDGMVRYAESAGWVTAPGHVDAHCEYEGEPAP